jgi:hypothetical protein
LRNRDGDECRDRNPFRDVVHLQVRNLPLPKRRVEPFWLLPSDGKCYFRVGNSGRAFGKIKYEVERKVRRLAAKKCKRKGFG